MTIAPTIVIPERPRKSSRTEPRAPRAEPAFRGFYARYRVLLQTGRFEFACSEAGLATGSPGHETPAGNSHTCWDHHRRPPPRIPTNRMHSRTSRPDAQCRIVRRGRRKVPPQPRATIARNLWSVAG